MSLGDVSAGDRGEGRVAGAIENWESQIGRHEFHELTRREQPLAASRSGQGVEDSFSGQSVLAGTTRNDGRGPLSAPRDQTAQTRSCASVDRCWGEPTVPRLIDSPQGGDRSEERRV